MFCRFCGKELRNDSIFCSYCGKRLESDGAPASDDGFDGLGSFFESAVQKKRQEDLERRAALDRARALVIMDRAQPALEAYDELIEKDPADAAGYIGYIRVASCNFTRFDNSIYHSKANTYISVRNFVGKVTALLGATPSGDSEYDEFIQRMEAHDNEQMRQRKEAEEKERKRREDEEAEKRRRKEEEERQKPIKLAEALKNGLDQYRELKYTEAYTNLEIVLNLSNELQKSLPYNFRSYFEPLCRMYPSSARNNPLVMEYFKCFADKNDAEAQYTLGLLYQKGKSEYVSGSWGQSGYYKYPEEHLAQPLFKKAIDNGSVSAIIMMGDRHYQQSNNYEDANKKRECYLQAVYWYQKAVSLGSAEAENKMALCYRFGYGVAKDLDQAIRLYKKNNAYSILGDIYSGYPLNDFNTAISYYKMANSYYKVASLYEKLGNKREAIEYYRKCLTLNDYTASEAEKRIAILMYG